MKRTSKLFLATATALTLGLGTAVAYAHPAGDTPACEHGPGNNAGPMGMGHGMGPGMGHGMGPGMERGMGQRGPGFGNPTARAEGQLAWLKSMLKITAPQEAVWNAFADQRRHQAEAMATWVKGAPDKPAATVVERMERRSAMAKLHLEQADKMLTAFKALYAAMGPEQKALLDQDLIERGLVGPGGRHRGH